MASDKKRFSDKGLRLQSWDYGWNGKYFITINTKDKVECFGDVISEELHHSVQGRLANEFWEMIPEKFPFARLDEFIVMPNHVHGIIEIDKSTNSRPAESESLSNSGGTANSGESNSGDAHPHCRYPHRYPYHRYPHRCNCWDYWWFCRSKKSNVI